MLQDGENVAVVDIVLAGMVSCYRMPGGTLPRDARCLLVGVTEVITSDESKVSCPEAGLVGRPNIACYAVYR